MIDSIPMFVLTFGIACYHAPGITEVLRFPYCTDKIQKDWKKKLAERPNSLRAQSERAGGEATEAGRVLAEKVKGIIDYQSV